ncbi:MAG: hypothetical protein FWE31_02860 [Firmicutes bacterium]|nr:hypothetical protein [Bacillota bacterium]
MENRWAKGLKPMVAQIIADLSIVAATQAENIPLASGAGMIVNALATAKFNSWDAAAFNSGLMTVGGGIGLALSGGDIGSGLAVGYFTGLAANFLHTPVRDGEVPYEQLKEKFKTSKFAQKFFNQDNEKDNGE